MTVWQSATRLVGCSRCGRALRVHRTHNLNVFCSQQCQEWHREEIAQRKNVANQAREARQRWEHQEMLLRLGMHVVYPQMLGAMDWVQRQRPSYQTWIGRKRYREAREAVLR